MNPLEVTPLEELERVCPHAAKLATMGLLTIVTIDGREYVTVAEQERLREMIEAGRLEWPAVQDQRPHREAGWFGQDRPERGFWK